MFVRTLVVLSFLFLSVWGVGAGPVFRYSHKLLTLKTDHFTFIFPQESQPEAEYLASIAEDLYADVASKLQVPTNLHLPVVLSPDTDDINGYFTSVPSLRIVLYQAPLSPNSGFAILGDTPKKLFLHELTHAVSLSQTDGFGAFLVALFGDAVRLGMYYTPAAFVEGVTVSFESLDGLGRANDAAFASVIQQAIVEDRWPTFTEATGAWAGYPGGIHYIYGSWFSRYLQETEGMEKYAALFEAFGRAQGLDDFLWIPGTFRKVYGRSLTEAWEGFRQWMALKVPVRTDLRPVDDGPGRISATAGRGDAVYWSDFRGLWTLEGGRPVFLTELGRYANKLAVSPDGSRLLISRSEVDGSLSTAVLTEWDVAQRRPTGRAWPQHLAEAAFWRDGIVACRIRGYTMDLVSVGPDGERVLVTGTDRWVPSAPTPLADGRIAFLLQNEGVQRLGFLAPDTGEVSVVTDSGLDGIRQLGSDGQRLWFSWDNDRTFLKLGALDGDRLTVYPPVSGGVQFPVGAAGRVYYVGSQARGQRLMELPDLPSETRSFQLTRLELPGASGRETARLPEARPYQPWLWTLLPQWRYPTLVLNPFAQGLDLIRGAGIGTWSTDPAEMVSVSTGVEWIWTKEFAQWNLGLSTTVLPVDVGASAYDRLAPHLSRGHDVRQTGMNLWVADQWTGVTTSLGWELDAGTLLATEAGAAVTAFPLGLSLGLEDTRPVGFEGEKWGYGLGTSWYRVEGSSAGRGGVVSADATVYLPFWRTQATFTGVGVTDGRLSLGTSGPLPDDGSLWLGSSGYAVSPLYEGKSDLSASRLFQGDVNFGFSLPIRRDLPAGAYAHSLDLQSGYQGFWLGNSYLDNVYSRLVLNFRTSAVPRMLSLPLALGLRIDFGGLAPDSARSPRLSLDVGEAFY